MTTPHFPIHWQFIPWLWCPEHDCLLEDVCPACGGEFSFPVDIAESAAGRMGYGLLNRCQICGFNLASIEPCYLQFGVFRRVYEIEDMTLNNGRALLAALCRGWFSIQGERTRRGLEQFALLERHGVLAVRMNWLKPAVVRKRSTYGVFEDDEPRYEELQQVSRSIQNLRRPPER
jgi:hypothetical protein